MTFQWQPLECFEENGPITGYYYRVYYNLVDYVEGLVGSNKAVLTLLHINIQAFSVAAMNEAGIGEHCPPVQIPNYNLGNNNIPCLNERVALPTKHN